MELLEMVGDVVKSQASSIQMEADELAESIKKVYRALRWVQTQEEKSALMAEKPAISGLESIQRSKVICLECGKECKTITWKHLAIHALDPRGYKQKHGIPLSHALSARSLSAKRRRSAKERGLGEKLQKARKRKGKK